MQIQIVNGIYTSGDVDYHTSYPVNRVPVPKSTGLSNGYLRAAEGLTRFDSATDTTDVDRGGINWNGSYFRVCGSQVQKIDKDGSVRVLGNVSTNNSQASLTYGFDRLAIVSGGMMYYVLNDMSMVQVTDTDLGYVTDVVWIDGYFAFTDGTSIGVTELNDPLSVNPLKYGSSEADPDPIIALVNFRDQLIAFNRYTIETFDNQGGDNFPFVRVDGAIIEKGAVSKDSIISTGDDLFFLGSGRNEPCSIYLGSGGVATSISTRQIDELISTFTETELSGTICDFVPHGQNKHMYFHLPTVTAVYDLAASVALGSPIYFYLASGTGGDEKYTAHNFVWCYDKWLCGDKDSNRIGYLDSTVCNQYGEVAGWEFQTPIVFNDAAPFSINNLELVGIQGRYQINQYPTVFASYSSDGATWSNERLLSAGAIGTFKNRLASRQWGRVLQQRIFKFRGADECPTSWAYLHADVEALNGW